MSGSVGGVVATNIWDRKNRRHVTSELYRYKTVTNQVMEHSQYVSMSGPDGTKVGTGYSVLGSAVACSKKRKCAIAPPQVHVFIQQTQQIGCVQPSIHACTL